jgi:hypothetical protein
VTCRYPLAGCTTLACTWCGARSTTSRALRQEFPHLRSRLPTPWSRSTRSSIERTIAWTATQNGRRVKLRYLGTTKNDAWLHTRRAGLNLQTLLNAGLARSGGAWALA